MTEKLLYILELSAFQCIFILSADVILTKMSIKMPIKGSFFSISDCCCNSYQMGIKPFEFG